ncbi:GH39 family glycosyl hydrolase [Nocardioides perillae]|uniref:Glycosyl hydrolases family 39 N-terminal catalytic domain-containing protein n=1 Tax=Nocardioides perillae TaxID=1119534 RepID=A0A7Y9RPV8_9ACTN|nr:hypothetical protein [Nocardioides perillae]
MTRRVLLLLLPGLLCLALAVVGLSVIRSLEDAEPAVGPVVACEPSRSRPGPLIDLGVQAAGGVGQGEELGSTVTYPELTAPEIRRLVARAEAAGAAVISTAASWRTIEPDPDRPYDWTLLDRVIDAANAAGLRVRLQVSTMPQWAVEETSSPTDTDFWHPPLTDTELRRWTRFVHDLTVHVQGRVDYLEIWNEPNEYDFWPTGPDPVAFARLLEASYAAVKEVDPSISIVSGGLSNNDIGFLRAVYDARDELYGEDEVLFDQVGVHPFSGDRSPSTELARWTYEREPFGEFSQNFLGIVDLHDLMEQRGDADKPLYIGEFGYSTQPWREFGPVSDADRAVYLEEAFRAATCYSYVSALSWYYFHPTRFNEPSWTLLDRQGQPNETYAALVAWARRVGALR